jgi:hypothetical protein
LPSNCSLPAGTTDLEDKSHAEAVRHFAEHLKQFPASREAVERLERDATKITLAASMAVIKPTPKQNVIQADDGAQWHKSVDIMENIHLCHRPISYGAEYAVVEHFPVRGSNEILSRGWNAGEVLKSFIQGQRQALQLWTEDMSAQVKEFLAEKFPGQDLSRVADAFVHKCTTQAVSQKHSLTHSHEQNHSHRMRV